MRSGICQATPTRAYYPTFTTCCHWYTVLRAFFDLVDALLLFFFFSNLYVVQHRTAAGIQVRPASEL